jgi:hypothetical protein
VVLLVTPGGISGNFAEQLLVPQGELHLVDKHPYANGQAGRHERVALHTVLSIE